MSTASGYVYVIQFGDYVKIGYSQDPHGRMKQLVYRNEGTLKPPNPEPPVPIAAFPGSLHTEHVLHLAFHNDRAIGEYYHYRGVVKEWCDRLVLDEANLATFKPPKAELPPTRYVFVHCGKEHVDEDLEIEDSEVLVHPDDEQHNYVPSPVDF